MSLESKSNHLLIPPTIAKGFSLLANWTRWGIQLTQQIIHQTLSNNKEVEMEVPIEMEHDLSFPILLSLKFLSLLDESVRLLDGYFISVDFSLFGDTETAERFHQFLRLVHQELLLNASLRQNPFYLLKAFLVYSFIQHQTLPKRLPYTSTKDELNQEFIFRFLFMMKLSTGVYGRKFMRYLGIGHYQKPKLQQLIDGDNRKHAHQHFYFSKHSGVDMEWIVSSSFQLKKQQNQLSHEKMIYRLFELQYLTKEKAEKIKEKNETQNDQLVQSAGLTLKLSKIMPTVQPPKLHTPDYIITLLLPGHCPLALQKPTICLTVRGTLGLSDFINTLTCDYIPIELKNNPNYDLPEELFTKDFNVHRGIWQLALEMARKGSPVYETIFYLSQLLRDFDLLLCGHSLGGAVVTLLHLLWSPVFSKFFSPELAIGDLQLKQSVNLFTYSFAPPSSCSKSLREFYQTVSQKIPHLGFKHQEQIYGLVFNHDFVSGLSLGFFRGFKKGMTSLIQNEELIDDLFQSLLDRWFPLHKNISSLTGLRQLAEEVVKKTFPLEEEMNVNQLGFGFQQPSPAEGAQLFSVNQKGELVRQPEEQIMNQLRQQFDHYDVKSRRDSTSSDSTFYSQLTLETQTSSSESEPKNEWIENMQGFDLNDNDDLEWHQSIHSVLLAEHLEERHFPLGTLYWLHTFTESEEGEKEKVKMNRIENVERVFGEMRFSRRMLLDHSPGKYEKYLIRLLNQQFDKEEESEK